MRRLFHVTINSFYVMIVKYRYNGPDYVKLHLRYINKANDIPFADERNVKIMKDKIKHWERWDENAIAAFNETGTVRDEMERFKSII